MSDAATTLPDVLLAALRRTGRAPALRWKRFGLWHPVSGDEVAARAAAVAAGLRGLGITPGDTVGLFGGNCLEWVIADLGSLSAGAVPFGLDAFADAAEFAEALRAADVRLLFVEGEHRLRLAQTARAKCPSLKAIVLLRRDWRAAGDGEAIRTLAELEADAAGAHDADATDAANTAIIVPTAGTTGPSRSVRLPHRLVCAQVRRAVAALSLRSGDERLTLLPIHHVSERVTGVYAAIAAGAIVNFPENAETAAADLAELQPSIVQLSARQWSAMRSAIDLTLEDTTPLQRRAVARALRSRGGLLDRIALKPLRRRLGIEGARLCLSVGAALPPDTAAWFESLGRGLHSIYAITEAAGAVAITPAVSGRMAALDGIELTASRDGDIRLRAPDLAATYVDSTPAVTTDGWFATGDRFAEAGPVGRTAHAIEAGGAVLHPFEREAALRASRYIADAAIVGERGTLRAVVLLDPEQVAKFAQKAAIPFTHFRSLTEAEPVRALIGAAIEDVNRRFPMPRLAGFILVERALAAGDAELGPTMALRRYRIGAGIAPTEQAEITNGRSNR